MILNKKMILSTVAVVLLISIFWINKPVPKIYLHNQTTKNLYIYTMQSVFNMEPTSEELQQLKRIKIIKPNEQLSLSVSAYYSEDTQFFTKWKIGSQSGTGGYIRTLVNNKNGTCGIDVFIKEDSIEVVDKVAIYCPQKLFILQKIIGSEVVD